MVSSLVFFFRFKGLVSPTRAPTKLKIKIWNGIQLGSFFWFRDWFTLHRTELKAFVLSLSIPQAIIVFAFWGFFTSLLTHLEDYLTIGDPVSLLWLQWSASGEQRLETATVERWYASLPTCMCACVCVEFFFISSRSGKLQIKKKRVPTFSIMSNNLADSINKFRSSSW